MGVIVAEEERDRQAKEMGSGVASEVDERGGCKDRRRWRRPV